MYTAFAIIWLVMLVNINKLINLLFNNNSTLISARTYLPDGRWERQASKIFRK